MAAQSNFCESPANEASESNFCESPANVASESNFCESPNTCCQSSTLVVVLEPMSAESNCCECPTYVVRVPRLQESYPLLLLSGNYCGCSTPASCHQIPSTATTTTTSPVSQPSPSSSGCTQQEKEPPSFSVCSFSHITDAEMKVFRCSDCQGGYGRHEELVLCSNCKIYVFHTSCVSQVDRHGELCFQCLQHNMRSTESSPLEDTTSNASGLTGNSLFREHHLDRVDVAPDGSCWIYAVCAGLGILEHGHVGSQQDKMQYSVAGGWINFA